MKLFGPALAAPAHAAIALTCCHAGCLAESAGEVAPIHVADNLPDRLHRWFNDDWTAGWDTGSRWRLIASPVTYHYSNDSEHRHSYMLGVERARADGFLLGGTAFRNSFGQPSAYLYLGQRFDRLGGFDAMFGQITGGLLYGYKPPYNDKVPFNYRGFSPGIVPSVGWQFTRSLSAQVNILGNSALMLQFSVDLP